jgi:hypothetical protein
MNLIAEGNGTISVVENNEYIARDVRFGDIFLSKKILDYNFLIFDMGSNGKLLKHVNEFPMIFEIDMDIPLAEGNFEIASNALCWGSTGLIGPGAKIAVNNEYENLDRDSVKIILFKNN